jgi:DNA modification methylase
VILDMFAGSGTTGVAALAENRSFVGVELTDAYLPILLGRISHALGLPPPPVAPIAEQTTEPGR